MGSRVILHIDMDAFYASVEQRDAPNLRGKPVIVGGHLTRGVVLAASYEARAFGIRSGMPYQTARQRAPQAHFVAARHDVYAEASEQIFQIFQDFTPIIEPLSLDEAFLDMTHSQALFGSAKEIAQAIRKRVLEEVGLPCSAGIAPVKFVAKLASDLAKPNGQLEVTQAEMVSFLAPLPVGRLWGVGAKTEETLHRMGLRTLADVTAQGAEAMERALGASGRHLWCLSQGLDDREVEANREAKSIGAENTFEEDVREVEELIPLLHGQALRVARRLRKLGKLAPVVQLKIKYDNFEVLTRQHTLAQPTDDGQTLYVAAVALLRSLTLRRAVRLTGVSAQGVTNQPQQMTLFSAPSSARDKLNRALDRISDKLGPSAVLPADLFPGGKKPTRR